MDGAADNRGPVAGLWYNQDVRTVQRLRYGVAAIGLLMPLVLPFGNWIFVQLGHHTQIMPTTMSGSYYTGTRNIFVGGLWALGVFLIGYRATPKQDLWTTVIGVFAIGVAMCPTTPTTPAPTRYQSVVGDFHVGFAAVLLTGLALFCITSFHRESNAGKETTNYSYLVAGVLILVCVVVAAFAAMTHWGYSWTLTPIYTCEALSVWTFGAAWLEAAIELGRRASSASALKASAAPSQGSGVSSALGQQM